MKKVTRSSLEKILSYISLYEKQGFPDENRGRLLREVNAFIREICPDITSESEGMDVEILSESDLQISAVVLTEKIKMCLKTLLSSSDLTMDKSTIQVFLEELS